MKINVGSKNPTKINGVIEALKLYPEHFSNAEVIGVTVEVEEFGHPKSIEQTVKGAVERAKAAFTDCNYSVGLEGGLMEVPLSRTGYLEVPVCAIYDGKNMHIGFGCAFEWPKAVVDLILNGNVDASAAFHKLGLTEHKKLGAVPGGNIGYLSKGRMTREEQIKQSIICALVQLEHKELY